MWITLLGQVAGVIVGAFLTVHSAIATVKAARTICSEYRIVRVDDAEKGNQSPQETRGGISQGPSPSQ